MTKVSFIFLKHKCFKGEKWVFTLANKYDTDEHTLDELLKKFYGKKVKDYMGEWRVEKLAEPNSFPKFSNEIKFYFVNNKKRIENPEIIGVKWSGYEWQYRLKNIGHEYDYFSEDRLTAI